MLYITGSRHLGDSNRKIVLFCFPCSLQSNLSPITRTVVYLVVYIIGRYEYRFILSFRFGSR
jgi:hypothetical protein